VPTITRTEYLEVNNVPLATPAWEVLDLSPLWGIGGLRGEDRVIPFADGKSPLRRVRDDWREVVPIVIYGDFDQNNVAQSNTRTGLQANIDYLRDNILTPNTTDPGTWTLKLHMPDSTIRTAECFVLPPMQLVPLSPMAVRGVLDILIPAGKLTI